MHEILKKRTFAVDPVKRFGVSLGELHHAGGDDLEPGLFEPGQDAADDVAGDRVGLDNREGALNGHANSGIR